MRASSDEKWERTRRRWQQPTRAATTVRRAAEDEGDDDDAVEIVGVKLGSDAARVYKRQRADAKTQDETEEKEKDEISATDAKHLPDEKDEKRIHDEKDEPRDPSTEDAALAENALSTTEPMPCDKRSWKKVLAKVREQEEAEAEEQKGKIEAEKLKKKYIQRAKKEREQANKAKKKLNAKNAAAKTKGKAIYIGSM
jgi:hypothetical protein